MRGSHKGTAERQNCSEQVLEKKNIDLQVKDIGNLRAGARGTNTQTSFLSFPLISSQDALQWPDPNGHEGTQDLVTVEQRTE